MSTGARLAVFAVALVAIFAAAVGLGTAVGPLGPAEAARAGGEHRNGGHGAEAAPDPAVVLAGLAVSERGYTLALDAPGATTGPATPVSFRVLGPDGRPVTDYDESHDENLHLIAVRRDLAGFQHVHPELGADGTWRTALDLTPGTWRLFADFVPGADGEKLVLGADLDVAGEYAPSPLPGPAEAAEVDGYTVSLDGDLAAGRESELTLTVHRDGRPVTDLQPYLAAYGHLVVLRDGDLGYLHVHPAGEPGDGRTAPGPEIRFFATAPTAGTYRLFLDFRHGDVVRTAEFTVEVGTGSDGTGESALDDAPDDGPDGGHGSHD